MRVAALEGVAANCRGGVWLCKLKGWCVVLMLVPSLFQGQSQSMQRTVHTVIVLQG
jgi:hypothetical protein